MSSHRSTRLQLGVGAKIALSFGAVGLLLAGLLVVALADMSRMSTAHHRVADVVVPTQLAADRARSAAADMHFSETEYALDGGRSRSNYAGDRAAFGVAFQALATHSQTAVERA